MLFATQALQGDLMSLFSNPQSMALALFAFIPATVFAYLAEHLQKKLNKIVGNRQLGRDRDIAP